MWAAVNDEMGPPVTGTPRSAPCRKSVGRRILVVAVWWSFLVPGERLEYLFRQAGNVGPVLRVVAADFDHSGLRQVRGGDPGAEAAGSHRHRASRGVVP